MKDIKKEIYVNPIVEELDLKESFNFGIQFPGDDPSASPMMP